jgi:3-hydroxyisobutyrate dehydrogenase
MTDELGARRLVAEAVEALYTGIDDQDLTVPEIIRVLAEEK